MVYESLIAIVESHLSDLTQTWVDEVKKSTHLNTYQKLSDEELFNRGNTLFVNIQNWLINGASLDDAEIFFYNLGFKRFKENFPLTEIYYALHLEKKVLWSFIAWKDNTSRTLEAHDAIEFMTIINNYFDLGDFNLIRGYVDELHTQLSNSKKYNATELENLIPSKIKHQENISKYLFSEGLNIDSIK
ncbi:MAG: hypothetical protein V3V16_00595 [Melioribacteraceae bacterium]